MKVLPTPDQVRQLPAVRTAVVGEDALDENDHMTIGRYFEELARALWDRTIALGMGQEYIDGRGLSTFTAEQHLTYLGELRRGDEFSLHVRMVERSDKVLHAVVMMLDVTRDRLACVFESTAVHVDMATRRPAPFPDDIAVTLDAALHADAVDWPAPLCGAMGVRRT